jgi:hypothetical protein
MILWIKSKALISNHDVIIFIIDESHITYPSTDQLPNLITDLIACNLHAFQAKFLSISQLYMLSTCFTHLILLNLFILTIFGEDRKLLAFS